jgi:pilus assembly protein CpaC
MNTGLRTAAKPKLRILPRSSHCKICLPFIWLLLIASIANGQPRSRALPGRQPVDVLTRDKIDRLIHSITEAEAELKIPMRRSKLIRMNTDIIRAAVADPGLIEFVAFGTKEIELIGVATGRTTVTLWLGDPAAPEVLSFLVNVEYDRGVDAERRAEYHELEISINELFPNSRVRLFPVADKLIVKGQARDAEEASQIMSVLRSGGQSGIGGIGGVGGGFGDVNNSGLAALPFPGASNIPPSSVINMLIVPGEQQVLLKVRIAELSRSSARTLSANINVDIGDFLASSTLGGPGNLFVSGTFGADSFNATLRALESHGVAKILAQPNLMTLSGRPATFIAGGEFAVPTVVGVGGAQAATTSFHGFGTQLSFTPTVLDKDRIRLQVNPSFSALNQANSVNGIPGLNTRATSTTVDLREGQVLAIAGLIESSQTGSRVRVPWLGTLPIIGWPFNNKTVARSETELVILVSPELVSAMDPCDVPSLLPGMELTEPSDHDFYKRSMIEGRPNVNHRSTVWPTYRDQLLNPKLYINDCERSQGYFMQGMHGLSN